MTHRHLVLGGGGHAHLAVLTALARSAPADLSVTLVTPTPRQVYSGMLPGWIAGHYSREQCEINLEALAEDAEVRFVEGCLCALDVDRRCVTLADGNELGYDLLSLDVGSQTDLGWLKAPHERVLPVRPLDNLLDHWPKVLNSSGHLEPDSLHLVIVGDGAAAVEIALAAQYAFSGSVRAGSVGLVTAGEGVLPGFSRGVRRRVEQAISASGLRVLSGPAADSHEGLKLPDGEVVSPQWVIAATGGVPPEWLRDGGPELDDRGFVRVDPYHRSVSHPEVFAAGDVCVRQDVQMARSGVHAVHAGQILAHNLLAGSAGRSLRAYRPRRHSLYLLATGPRHAVASWGPLTAQGRWAWRWKDRIDRGFVDRH